MRSTPTPDAPTPDTLTDALREAADVAHHPRVRRLRWDGQELVAVGPRTGADGRQRLAAEAELIAAAAKLRTSSGSAVTITPLVITPDQIVVPWVGPSSLHDQLVASPAGTADHADDCGELLAALHAAPCPVDRPARQELPQTYPLSPEQWAELPDTVLATMSELHHHDALRACAERARARSASGGSWVHGDFKPDNLLLATSGASGPQLRAIDWELSGRGAEADDFGALFAGLTLARVARVASSGAKNSLSTDLRTGLDLAVRALSRTLAAYRRHRSVDAAVLTAEALADAMVLRLVARSQGLARTSPGPTPLLGLVSRLAGQLLARREILTATLARELGLAVR